jgi:hypothetical protein
MQHHFWAMRKMKGAKLNRNELCADQFFDGARQVNVRAVDARNEKSEIRTYISQTA